MAYRYTCGICNRTFRDDTRSDLIDKVQQHGKRQHDTEMDKSEIREDIMD